MNERMKTKCQEFRAYLDIMCERIFNMDVSGRSDWWYAYYVVLREGICSIGSHQVISHRNQRVAELYQRYFDNHAEYLLPPRKLDETYPDEQAMLIAFSDILSWIWDHLAGMDMRNNSYNDRTQAEILKSVSALRKKIDWQLERRQLNLSDITFKIERKRNY